MRSPYDVIKQPIITEKSTTQMAEENVYAFVVDNAANKIEIAYAVEKIWDVKVKDVRTMRYAGKMRRSLMGRLSRSRDVGRRPSYKKALVSLAEGDTIEFYEVG
jgi:large subunit ribosomal protein L23